MTDRPPTYVSNAPVTREEVSWLILDVINVISAMQMQIDALEGASADFDRAQLASLANNRVDALIRRLDAFSKGAS